MCLLNTKAHVLYLIIMLNIKCYLIIHLINFHFLLNDRYIKIHDMKILVEIIFKIYLKDAQTKLN